MHIQRWHYYNVETEQETASASGSSSVLSSQKIEPERWMVRASARARARVHAVQVVVFEPECISSYLTTVECM